MTCQDNVQICGLYNNDWKSNKPSRARWINTQWLTPRETGNFVSPRASMSPERSRGEHWGRGETKFTVSRGTSLEVLCYTSQLKNGKKSKKSFAWRRLNDKYAAVSRNTTGSRGSRKFLLFPKGVSEFVCPRELVSFYPRHVILPRPIEKRILVGTYENNSLRVAKA